MNDLEASLGLEAVDVFWQTFNTRYKTMKSLRRDCKRFEDIAYFSEEDEGNRNCPHGFSITLKDSAKLKILTSHLDKCQIHWKRNFGCIPTQHKAFEYLGHKLGDFPEAEHVGDAGIHIGVHQHLTEDDIEYISTSLSEALDKCY